MTRVVRVIFCGAVAIAFAACASLEPESTKERTYEPYTKTEAEPDGYDDPCFDRKKAKKTPGCLAYDPDA